MAGPKQESGQFKSAGTGKSAQDPTRAFINCFSITRKEKMLEGLKGELDAWAGKYASLLTKSFMRGAPQCNMSHLGKILEEIASLNKNAAFSFSEEGSHLSFGEKEAKKYGRYYNQLTVFLHEKNGHNGGKIPVLNISVFTNPGGNWTAHVEYENGYAPNGTVSSSTPLGTEPEKMDAFAKQLEQMKVADFIAAFDPGKKHR